MNKQRLLIDMDDVMADASGRFYQYLHKHTGQLHTREASMGLDWRDLLPPDVPYSVWSKWVHEDGFFREMAVMPDAQEVIKALQDRYEVFVVSAAIEFPNSLKEKVEWLAEHFPFISWKYVVLCGHKYMIRADYLIDDHRKNLETFEGNPLLFTAPHNARETDFERVNNWKEVAQRLL
jgi:5'-nucleotidase